MNKTILAVGLILAGAATVLSAAGFEDSGYTITGKSVEDGKDVYALQDAGGFPFTVVLAGEPTRRQQESLKALIGIFRSLQRVPIASLRIAFAGEAAEIILVPRPFSHQGQELASFMPSGMQFYYDGYLEYDFRMKADNLFFRVRGQFFAEDQFLDRLAGAARNPAAFIHANDPEFVYRRLLELEKKMDDTAAWGRAALDGLERKNDGLAAESSDLEREFLLLRYALLVLHNRGFFGSIRLPSGKGIERLVEMKKGEPSLSRETAAARLRAEGIEMSSKEVFLVFSVYFNEFQ